MGTAVLGFAGGPQVTFRIDPQNISWNWNILTNVIETIGGRVVQVIGAYLSDLQIEGSFGQDHSQKSPRDESWFQAEAFFQAIESMMEFQSQDSNQQSLMHPPATFSYPPQGLKFSVYIKDITDPEGGNSVTMTPGKFNNRYLLTLFIVQDGSDTLVKAGDSNGVVSQNQAAAIDAYFARISDGIGWHISQYNGPMGGPSTVKPKAAAPAPVPAGTRSGSPTKIRPV
jgi:hypothetical protein